MTNEEAIRKLKDIQFKIATSGTHGADVEYGHEKADDVLCDFLTDLGFGAIVLEYKKIEKWYA